MFNMFGRLAVWPFGRLAVWPLDFYLFTQKKWVGEGKRC